MNCWWKYHYMMRDCIIKPVPVWTIGQRHQQTQCNQDVDPNVSLLDTDETTPNLAQEHFLKAGGSSSSICGNKENHSKCRGKPLSLNLSEEKTHEGTLLRTWILGEAPGGHSHSRNMEPLLPDMWWVHISTHFLSVGVTWTNFLTSWPVTWNLEAGLALHTPLSKCVSDNYVMDWMS